MGKATPDGLENHIKNGIQLNVHIGDSTTAAFNLANDADASAIAASRQSEFSPTNTQVQVRVRISRPERADLDEAAEITLEDSKWGDAGELYLLEGGDTGDALTIVWFR